MDSIETAINEATAICGHRFMASYSNRLESRPGDWVVWAYDGLSSSGCQVAYGTAAYCAAAILEYAARHAPAYSIAAE